MDYTGQNKKKKGFFFVYTFSFGGSFFVFGGWVGEFPGGVQIVWVGEGGVGGLSGVGVWPRGGGCGGGAMGGEGGGWGWVWVLIRFVGGG